MWATFVILKTQPDVIITDWAKIRPIWSLWHSSHPCRRDLDASTFGEFKQSCFRSGGQDCQMVSFHTKNPNLEGLGI
jgi:hypothetical protein